MSRAEYMIIHSKYLTPDIRPLYQIDELVAEYGYVYIIIIKGMYGLKQAAIIACNQLIYNMETHSYYTVPFTTVLWYHKTRRTKFFLCVDDFGGTYFNKDDSDHLLEPLEKHYAISIDWEVCNFL